MCSILRGPVIQRKTAAEIFYTGIVGRNWATENLVLSPNSVPLQLGKDSVPVFLLTPETPILYCCDRYNIPAKNLPGIN